MSHMKKPIDGGYLLELQRYPTHMSDSGEEYVLVLLLNGTQRQSTVPSASHFASYDQYLRAFRAVRTRQDYDAVDRSLLAVAERRCGDPLEELLRKLSV